MSSAAPSESLKVVTGVRLGVLDISPTQGGISIRSIPDDAASVNISSPRSLEACLRQGVEPQELEYR